MMMNCLREGSCLIVTLSGRLDGHTVQPLEEPLLAEIGPQTRTLILDLAELEYVSSLGLRLILLLGKRMKQAGGILRLCAMQPAVHEVFEISGLLRVLTLHATHLEALAAAKSCT